MKDLKKRFLFSLVIIPSLICLFVFSQNVWFQYVVVAFTATITCVAVWEYEQFVKAKGGRLLLPVILLFTFLEVVAFFVSETSPRLVMLPLIVFFVAFLSVFVLHFKEKEGAIVNLAVSSFGMTYIAVPMGMILGILYFSGAEDGRWWVAYLLVVTKVSDIGAYFAGNLWGRKKLAPAISPGKTIEGTFFGLVCAGLASFGFLFLSRHFHLQGFHIGVAQAAILGPLLGLIAPLGDLSESLLKRDANKKDSNVLPGFGGALDLIDSLLFNAPVLYLYLHFVAV